MLDSNVEGTIATLTPAAASAPSSLSSRGLLDPGARLGDALRAAEEQFERGLREEEEQMQRPRAQPQRHTLQPIMPPPLQQWQQEQWPGQRDQHAPHHSDNTGNGNDLSQAAPVAYGPGALIPARDEIASVFLSSLVDERSSAATAAAAAPTIGLGARSSPLRSSVRHHSGAQGGHCPQPSEQELQRALAEAQRPGRDFMHVSDWNAAADLDWTDAALSATESGQTPSSGTNVLLGVHDFSMPTELADLLELDLDAHGRLARFSPSQSDDFGRLVPLRAMHILHRLERDKPPVDEGHENDHAAAQRSHAHAHSQGASSSAHPLGQPLSPSAIARQHARSVSMASPRRADSNPSLDSHRHPLSPSFVPRLVHSHLHAGPDPAALHRHVALRRARESMMEIDQDLEVCPLRSALLCSALHPRSPPLRIDPRSRCALIRTYIRPPASTVARHSRFSRVSLRVDHVCRSRS